MIESQHFRILITRPQPSAARFASILHQEKCETFIEPMAECVAFTRDEIAQQLAQHSPPQTLIITSSAAIHSGCETLFPPDLPVWAVGSASAAAAQQAGFLHVHAGDNDAAALAQRITQLVPKNTALLYLRAEEIAYDLANHLRRAGYLVEECVTYRMQPRAALTDDLITAIRKKQIHVATFFSAAAAQSWGRLVKQAALFDDCAGICAVAFSPQVAEALRAIGWKSLLICPEPKMDCMIKTLRQLRENSAASID